MKYLASIIGIFVFVNIYGQQITVNKKQSNISNIENREIAVYFNHSFLPKDFSVYEDSILNIYSRLAGYPVSRLTKKDFRSLRKSDSPKYLVVEIEKVNEEWKSHCHASNKRRNHSYYSFQIQPSEKNYDIAIFNSTDCNLSVMDFYTSYYVLKYMIRGVSKGYSWRTCNNYLDEHSKDLKCSNLYLTEDYVSISSIELFESFPKNIARVSKEDLLKKIISTEEDFLFPYVCSQKGTAGKYFKTLLFDNKSKKIINTFEWEKK